MPWEYFKDSFSSIVSRCGPSLTEFSSPIPLSDAATNHLIQLPHLRVWSTECSPPSYSALSLPLGFPPLTEFTLEGNAAGGWISLLERLEHGVSPTQGVTPLSRVKKSLGFLTAGSLLGLVIGVSFSSMIRTFRNLIYLNLEAYCHDEDNVGQCTFKLNDDNVTELAMALPRLQSLLLGCPCFENICATTVTCLLPISVHCVKLTTLAIHFNTTNIVDDLKNISEGARFQELRSLPRCKLTELHVYQIPLPLDEPGFGAVAHGMADIFPALQHCEGFHEGWDGLSRRIVGLRQV
jgi:hypothetical protein